VAQVATEPIQFPNHERITASQRLEARVETRPVVAPAGSRILIDVLGPYASRDQRIALQIVGM
jgi:hypothetical protein